LSGELEFLDALIVPRTADSFLRLYLYLREAERQQVSTRLPPNIVLYDLLQTPGPDSDGHNIAQLDALRLRLEELADRRVSDSKLLAAIRANNNARQLQRELLRRRRIDPAIDGASVLKAIGARYFMPLTEYSALLRDWLESMAATANTAEKPRVLVAGNAHDNDSLHLLLRDAGIQVVGDYHWLGDPCAEEIGIAQAEDPWKAVSRHYHMHSLSSRRFPNPPEEIVTHANLCGARGVVFYLFDAEEALTWDAPNQERALRDAGLATLLLGDQTHVANASPELNDTLSAFAKQLRGAPP
jgi:benzoyl-CoA reductase/2-hydroxyglutaryl-CoA dehydratase subunit BcrC/BadD/HgdB